MELTFKRAFWPFFLGLWTLAAIVVVFLVARRPKPEPILIQNFESGQDFSWQLFDQTFFPIYGWIALAPWVIWLCIRFPLGIRRLRVALPILFIGAALFVFASHKFTQFYERKLPEVQYFMVSMIKKKGNWEFGAFDLGENGISIESSSEPKTRSEPPQAIVEQINEESFTEALMKGLNLGQNAELLDSNLVLDADASITSTVRGNNQSLDKVIDELLSAGSPETSGRPALFRGTLFHFGGFLFLGLFAHVGVFFQQVRQREQRHALISRELAEAKLSELHTQLRPHFLFNALNSISSEIHEAPDNAIDMVVHLSDLLRSSLTLDQGSSLIPLSQEIELLEDYLALQSLRFGEKIQIHRDFAEPSLSLLVPPFILQPLVENALQHGLEPVIRQGHLHLTSESTDKELIIQITDNGVGLQDEAPTRGTGTGLKNMRRRLETLFGKAFQLTIQPAEPAPGTAVTLRLPLSKHPAPSTT